MGGVDIADLEARALPRETARTEGGQPPLVGDLGERIGLIHELAELGRPEKLVHSRHDRLRVDQIAWHGRIDVGVDGHLFLDRPLHAHQTDAELVLHELADGADPPIRQRIDIVHATEVAVQAEQVTDQVEEILDIENAPFELLVEGEFGVEFETPDLGEVVLALVEEEPVEEGRCRLFGGRITGTLAAVDLHPRVHLSSARILLQGLVEDLTGGIPIGERQGELFQTGFIGLGQEFFGDPGIGGRDNLAGLGIDEIVDHDGADEVIPIDLDLGRLLDRRLLELGAHGVVELETGKERRLRHAAEAKRLLAIVLDIDQTPVEVEGRFLSGEAGVDDRVERPENLGVGLEFRAQGAQEDRPGQTPFAIDAHPENLLRVILELDPRATVGNHFREIVVRALEGEEHTRRPVQLGDDDSLGPVDDEGPGVGHQGELTEVELFFLDVPNLAGSILLGVESDQAESQPQRHLVGHPPFPAFLGRERLTETYRRPADIADLDLVGVGLPAGGAHDLGLVGITRLEPRTTVLADQSKVLETSEDPAPAGPVPDLIANKLELAGLTKIGEWKNRAQHRLQTG